MKVKQMLDDNMITEISIFRPNNRKKEATIESLIPRAAVNVLGERLGRTAKNKVRKAIESMGENHMEMSQIHLGDRRVRIRLEPLS